MTSPDCETVFTRAPDPGYRLPEAERVTLPTGIDSDVLERLLARTRPEHRAPVQASLREMVAELSERMATSKTTLGPPSVDFDDPGRTR